MKRTCLTTLFIVAVTSLVYTQSSNFQATKISSPLQEELLENFHQVEIFEHDGNLPLEYIQQDSFNYSFNLSFGKKYQWEFELHPIDMYSENAEIRVLTENGEESYPVPRNISYRGHVKGNTQKQVSFLIHDSYIYGHITEGSNRTYIVSANRYIKSAPQNQYLVFDRIDTKNNGGGTCGTDEHPSFHIHEDQAKKQSPPTKFTGLCYDVELGIASDWLLYTDKGSTVQGVINHTVGVMMDVETDYETADFDDALEFEIVEQVVSVCQECDPWTSSTDSGTLLSDFTSWGQNGGFNNSVDMGQHWSNRDFIGTTVGLAWNGSGLLCNQAFHVLQDYSTNADNLRVLTSHEIGHNLDADHDGSTGFIMSPSVNNTTTWSSTSKTTIDGIVDAAASSSCIIACAATPCSPVTDVSITSISSTGFTISWTATAEDNYRLRVRDEETKSIIHTSTPSSSGAMTINPAGWQICKDYMVIVENDCGSSVYSAPVSPIISKVDQGCADFSASALVGWSSLSTSFTDASLNASSWSWTFGDGGTSTLQNPSHTYSTAGVYDVTLSVNSGAHSTTKTSLIYVLPNESLPYTTASGGDMNGDDFGTQSITSGATSLWEKGIPSNYFTNNTTCWVTDLDADMTSAENEMALYSPRFDFTNVTAATLSFNLGMETTFANAPFGVQVQYTTNNGSSWTRLGADTDASWYNRGPSQSFSLASSIFSDEMGWLYTSQSVTWSYDVASLTGNSEVIFRFLFSLDAGWSSNAYPRDGAMVDNFEISATLLPVELVNFDGNLVDDNVELNWETATEINNDFFTIEKSIDGRSFESIGKVNGQGNSQLSHNYQLTDYFPARGINYYRLKQTDFGGQETYSEIVSVLYEKENQIHVYPNPFKDELNIAMHASQSEEVIIELIDLSGRLVLSDEQYFSNGFNKLRIDASKVSSGAYFVRVFRGSEVDTFKFVKE